MLLKLKAASRAARTIQESMALLGCCDKITKIFLFYNTVVIFCIIPVCKNRDDKSYFRKKFPCNTRRKTSGVGLFFRKKSKLLRNFSVNGMMLKELMDFQLTGRAAIRGINYPKLHLHSRNFVVQGSVFRIISIRDRSLQRESAESVRPAD